MDKIVFFTGAGLSAESGISTFRDNEDGLWTKYDPMEVCNIRNFQKNRELVFEFYNERRRVMPSIHPNEAHYGIARIQELYGEDRVILFTQNVDDLLERAGCKNVIHVHGRFTDMECLECNHTWDVGYAPYSSNERCPNCDGHKWVKPGVIFFGQNAPEYPNMYATFKKMRGGAVVAIGTAGEVVLLDDVVGNRRSPRRPYAILNNLDIDMYGPIDYNYLFDTVIKGRATKKIKRIEELLLEHVPL